MKKLISNYSFDASEKKITFSDYAAVDLESLLLVTNVTTNQIIYNFADPAAGGGVVGNVVTLVFDTSGMSDTDALQIFYDDPDVNAATEESMKALHEQNMLLRRLLKQADSLSTVDLAQRQRVAVDSIPSLTIGTFSPTNTTVKPVENANGVIYAINSNAFTSLVTIPDVWKFIDSSRLNYQQAIRSNIAFTV